MGDGRRRRRPRAGRTPRAVGNGAAVAAINRPGEPGARTTGGDGFEVANPPVAHAPGSPGSADEYAVGVAEPNASNETKAGSVVPDTRAAGSRSLPHLAEQECRARPTAAGATRSKPVCGAINPVWFGNDVPSTTPPAGSA